MKIGQWTRLPVIRLFRLGLIGFCLQLAVFLSLIGTTAVIAYFTGIYQNLEWNDANGVTTWYVFGISIGLAFLGGSTVCLAIFLADRQLQKEDIRVIVHMYLIVYWSFRCFISLCLMLIPNWLGAALIATIELDLMIVAGGLAFIAGLGYLLYLIPKACYKQCSKELARD